jgi:hypothetical protein
MKRLHLELSYEIQEMDLKALFDKITDRQW